MEPTTNQLLTTNPLAPPIDPNAPPPLTPEEKTAYEELFTFLQAKPYLSELERGFKSEVVRTVANRDRRLIDVDQKVERDRKNIKQSDVLVPMRVIDENIAREKPSYINYLQNSRRLAIFTDRLVPNDKHDDLELAFTRGMQYNDWITTYYKIVDGMQLHGWDWAEVLYDSDKPLHVGVEHIGHDRLEFSLDAEDIQNNIRVSRVYKWTRTQIDTAVKQFGFDPKQADNLKNYRQQKDTQTAAVKDQVYTVKKGYFKYQGIVYVCWYSLDVCDDWLLAPRKFFNGVSHQETVMVEQSPIHISHPMTGEMVPVQQPPQQTQQWTDTDETSYPIVLYAYEETEQKEISNRKGRAFKDKFKQEVMTTGWSATLNGLNRSTWIMAAKTTPTGRTNSEMETIEFCDGAILSQPVEFVKMPPPEPMMLQALQLFDTKNAQGMGQMSYAVQNKSSGARTTAKEVDSAEQATNLASTVNITLYSASLRKTMTLSWRIVQSQALQGKIQFFGEYQQIPSPSVPGEMELEFQNNLDAIKRDYDLRPAGDVDVVQRQELISGMMEFWAVVQNTPIAGDFLAELLRIKFAEKGDIWAQKLLAGDPKTVLLQQYLQIITGLVQNPKEALSIGPKEQQSLQTLIQETQQILNPQQTQQGTNSNAGQQSASNTSTATNNNQSAGLSNSSAGASPVAQIQQNSGDNPAVASRA